MIASLMYYTNNLMQLVILAAGRGTRMGDLTSSTPKPMLEVAGRDLLRHKLEVLPDEIDEVVMVIGYLGDKIKASFGDNYNGRPIKYVYQEKLEGTGKALWLCRELLRDKFMVMMGDDIYSKDDVIECAKYPWAILVKRVDEMKRGGRIVLDEDGNLKDIIEGENHNVKNAITNTGLYVLGKEIFNYELVKLVNKEEWGLPQTLLKAAKDFKVKVVEGTFWLPLSEPIDLKMAEENLKSEKIQTLE